MSEKLSLEKQVAAAWPPERWRDVTVLVAVSGGPDSVALLHVLRNIGSGGVGGLAVVHFNHRLRGDDSDRDAEFVVGLSRQLDLPCQVGQPDEASLAHDEATLRDRRYEFIQHCAEALGARYVATAHTATDQVETVLHRILRGTGLWGLSGIPRFRRLGDAVTLVRPLLDSSQEEVLQYLHLLGQPYRRDSTNYSMQYTRNRIRQELLPLLSREFNPGVNQAILRLNELACELREVVDEQTSAIASCVVVEQRTDSVVINVGDLLQCHSYLVRETLARIWRDRDWPLQEMGNEHWRRLAGLLRQQSGSICFPGRVVARRENKVLVLIHSPGQ